MENSETAETDRLSPKEKLKEWLVGDEFGMDGGVVEKLTWKIQGTLIEVGKRISHNPRAADLTMRMERRFSWPKYGRTFAMYKPAYIEAIGGKRLEQMRSEIDFRVLQVGIMARLTAEDLLDFSLQINRKAKVNVLDINQKVLRHAKTKGVNFLQADVLDLPLADDSQDLVMTQGLLDNLRSDGEDFSFDEIRLGRNKVFKAIARVLRPGGVAVLIEPSWVLGSEGEPEKYNFEDTGVTLEVKDKVPMVADVKNQAKWKINSDEVEEVKFNDDERMIVIRKNKTLLFKEKVRTEPVG